MSIQINKEITTVQVEVPKTNVAIENAVTQITVQTSTPQITISQVGLPGRDGVDGVGGAGEGFPYSGSAVITGSLLVSGSTSFIIIGDSQFSGSLDVTGSIFLNGVDISSAVAGTSGTSGVSGTSGTSGVSGTSGTSGVSGSSGTSGVSGSSGTSGVSGSSGTSGVSGSSGTSGVSGSSGTSGVSGTSGFSINSGSFATTGSNTFIGDEIFSGSITLKTPRPANGIFPDASYIYNNPITWEGGHTGFGKWRNYVNAAEHGWTLVYNTELDPYTSYPPTYSVRDSTNAQLSTCAQMRFDVAEGTSLINFWAVEFAPGQDGGTATQPDWAWGPAMYFYQGGQGRGANASSTVGGALRIYSSCGRESAIFLESDGTCNPKIWAQRVETLTGNYKLQSLGPVDWNYLASNQSGTTRFTIEHSTGKTEISGSLNVSSSFTASLAEGYTWVGGMGNTSKLVATSSFGGGIATLPNGVVSSSQQIQNYNVFATTGSNQFNGNQTITGSLIQGLGNIATGEKSHAEGEGTQAIGNFSHAEGLGTIAYANYSHAEGQDTIASGSHSHAEGLWTIALADHQHVQGKYNITSSVPAAFIVGNGTDAENRSNLIHAAGNDVEITGSLKINGSFTSSLAEGYTWVGGISNISKLVATSSFGGGIATLPNGLISASSQLTSSYDTRYTLSGSVVNSNINTGSFATTGSNSFNGNQTITGSLVVSAVAVVNGGITIPTGSVITLTSGSSISVDSSGAITGSLTGSVFGIGDVTAFSSSVNSRINSITSSAIPAGTISGSSQLTSSFDTRYAISASFVSSSNVSSIQTITSASYAALTPVSGTLYIIIG